MPSKAMPKSFRKKLNIKYQKGQKSTRQLVLLVLKVTTLTGFLPDTVRQIGIKSHNASCVQIWQKIQKEVS